MRGQWLGRYQGNLPGEILIDIDEENSRFLGYGILRPDHHIAPQAPIAFARFDVPKGNQFTTSGPVFCIDPRDGNIKTWSDVSSLFPGYTFAPSVSVNASLTGAQLSVTWTDSSGATGSAQIAKSRRINHRACNRSRVSRHGRSSRLSPTTLAPTNSSSAVKATTNGG